MKLRHILPIFLLLSSIPCVSARESAMAAHKAAHEKQLANARLGMDKEVIKDFLRQDVDRRESIMEEAGVLSAESSAMIRDLLSEARSHLGKRYRRGAKGPSAFDCSGFSSYVYRQFGYDLGASSGAQFMDGEKVDRKSLRAGDLVFFTGRNRKGGVGHVGIVVSADNETGDFKFIHASTSGGIKIDGCAGYYASRYLGGRRLITE